MERMWEGESAFICLLKTHTLILSVTDQCICDCDVCTLPQGGVAVIGHQPLTPCAVCGGTAASCWNAVLNGLQREASSNVLHLKVSQALQHVCLLLQKCCHLLLRVTLILLSFSPVLNVPVHFVRDHDLHALCSMFAAPEACVISANMSSRILFLHLLIWFSFSTGVEGEMKVAFSAAKETMYRGTIVSA